MSQREAFLKALEANKYDEAMHRVYADYCDENGLDEEAQFHREWTKQWQEAYDYMELFGKEIAEDEDLPTVAELLDIGKRFIEKGERSQVGWMGFSATNHTLEEGVLEKFWNSWHILMKLEMEEGFGNRDPFMCCGGG